MKPKAIVCLALAFLLVVFNHFSYYWMGYSDSSDVILAIDPIFGLLLEFCLFVYLFFLVIASLFQKPRNRWPLYSLVVFWPLIILTVVSLGSCGPLIVRGLRDRIMHDYSLDDLRHFAQDVNQGISFKSNLSPRKGIIHGDTFGLTESEKKVYSHLKEKYSFLHRVEDSQGRSDASIFSPHDNLIVLAWGGALLGHWGCSISANGSKNEVYPDRDTTILRASDDIYFFYGD
jgi:hypothetical protein